MGTAPSCSVLAGAAPLGPRWAQWCQTPLQRGMQGPHLCSERSPGTEQLPLTPSHPMEQTGERTHIGGWLTVHPLTWSSFHSIPLPIYFWSFMAAQLHADGRCLHMFLLSRTWGFAATSLFTVIFSSDTTRTPTLSGRLGAENKTKLFWDVFPFSSYLGAFPCG